MSRSYPSSTFLSILLGYLLSIDLSGQTFIKDTILQCGDSITIDKLGYPSWNEPVIVQAPKHNLVYQHGNFKNAMTFVSSPFYKGVDTVIVQCAKATQITCDTGIYIFHSTCAFTCDSISQVDWNCKSIYTIQLSSFGSPKIINHPYRGTAKIQQTPIDVSNLIYTPNPNYAGLDFLTYSIFNNKYCIEFDLDCITALTDPLPPQHLKLHPNPIRKDGVLISESPMHWVKLFDISGKNIQDCAPINNDISLPLEVEALPPGIYYLRVGTKDGVKVLSFLKL